MESLHLEQELAGKGVPCPVKTQKKKKRVKRPLTKTVTTTWRGLESKRFYSGTISTKKKKKRTSGGLGISA